MNAEAIPTHHALDRYRIFYPTASDEDLLQALSEGFEIDPQSAHAITGRNSRGLPLKKGTTYIMHKHRTGLFAVDKRNRVVVTFLRFNQHQEERVLSLWPVEPKPEPTPVIKTTASTLDYRTFLPDPDPKATARHLGQNDPPKSKSKWARQQEDLESSLPHVRMPPKFIRVSSSLTEMFAAIAPKPISAARKALVAARDTIQPLSPDLCTVEIQVGEVPHTAYLFRRRAFEQGSPEWWVGKNLPPELPEVEVKMALMLRRRGWKCFPPIPE